MSCPTIALRASLSTGTIDGEASQVWRFVVPLELIAKAGGGVVEGYPHDLQQGEKMRSQFLYNTTRSLYEQTGFNYDRPKGKKNCVMRTTVAPVKASRRARVGRL
jgi:hypothetical protein